MMFILLSRVTSIGSKPYDGDLEVWKNIPLVFFKDYGPL